ncbi:MAG: hypothetical protein EBR23_11245, partial [Planctomycetia bacterium]|nr:hypothetical protein [Planctomycetia bacterium]
FLFGRRFAASFVATLALMASATAADLAELSAQPLATGEGFRTLTPAALDSVAARLRSAIGPLDRLLGRSPSGAAWRDYLDWPALTSQAASGSQADPATLRRLLGLFDAGENGLEMHQFVAVRRALAAYVETAEAVKNPQAKDVFTQRLEKLAAAVAAAAAGGRPDALDPVGPLLARLEESGQAPATVARVRSAVQQPNLYLHVDENLLGSAVNRVVDEVTPVNDVLLGARVRGTGHTTGLVLLDFVPSADRATVDITLDATNHSDTRGTKGPVTVHTLGTTTIGARKRITISDQAVSSHPAHVSASTDTQTAGIGVGTKFAQGLIRKMASRKISQMKPQAEAVSAQRARERVRQQFESQLSDAIGQASRDYQAKFRRPLQERGWYPEVFHISTDDHRLAVVARKALADQVGAFTAPPAADPDAVLAARIHESIVNNAGEISLGGRTITQAFVDEQIKKNKIAMPESLQNEADQPPWSITFAKRRPVELDVDDRRVKLTVRGSRYTSGEREFPAMDVWAAYRIEPAEGKIRLVRDGDVQIYPPGFVPGGAEKLSVGETSLRRILQKRFNK